MSWNLEKLPFFEDRHYRLADRLNEWREANADLDGPHGDVPLAELARDIMGRLADWKFLDLVVPPADADVDEWIDVRSICIVREALAYDSPLADSMFVMQGLGLSPLWRHDEPELRREYLDRARGGETIAALALTEPASGSDVAATRTTARAEGDSFVIDGEKVWITNGGMADHYLVVARTGEAEGAQGLSAFLVDADTPGLSCGPQQAMIAEHPISSVSFSGCKVPASRRIGEAGSGFKAAMRGFDVFRPSVGAAAVGIARRALAESLDRVTSRHLFGKKMSELDNIRSTIADMAIDVDTAALSVYRAAYAADVIGGRVSREAATAKYVATEAAQRVCDSAVQLFGALGVAQGSVVERLYRDVRPMRIYEGASEIQKIVIARAVLAGHESKGTDR